MNRYQDPTNKKNRQHNQSCKQCCDDGRTNKAQPINDTSSMDQVQGNNDYWSPAIFVRGTCRINLIKLIN